MRARQPSRLRAAGSAAFVGAGIVGLLFLTLPLAVLTLRGVQVPGREGFSGAEIPQAVGLSIVTTAITATIIVLFGTPLAYWLARWRSPLRPVFVVLIELPIVMPPAVAGLALLLTFGRRGLLGPALGAFGISLPFSTAAVVLAQTFVAAPFYIRSAQVGFQGISREIEDAARVDGASGAALFRFVTLPLASRALASGLTLSWARALGEFGATILFAGSIAGRTQTMPLLVYGIFESNIDAAIWTSLILIGLALVALIVSQWLGSQTAREDTSL